MVFDFLIIGGDERFFHMAKILSYKNFKVLVYAPFYEKFDGKIKKTGSIKFAMKNCKNIICPIPFTKDFVFINSERKKIRINKLLYSLTSKNRLFGGCIPEKIVKILKKRDVSTFDYIKDKKFVVYNAVSTAEAAIAQAILQNPVNMHSSCCLVLGFGNCGRLISFKLKNLCSKVFVCTDDPIERVWAKACGFSVFGLSSLRFKVEGFKFIFNTIPKEIFNEDILDGLDENASILDITKFGENFNNTKKRMVNYKVSLGIPGKFKAVSAAENLVDTTLKILNKNSK